MLVVAACRNQVFHASGLIPDGRGKTGGGIHAFRLFAFKGLREIETIWLEDENFGHSST